jgi:RimJ/RimL family protein N-acetyltransferase
MLLSYDALRHKRKWLMKNGYVYTFTTKKGHLLKLRPLQAEDAHHLVDLFNHMGPTSRYLRFNLALTNPDPDLVWSEARRLAQIDPEKDGAWLAFCELDDQPIAPVAGVRYMRVEPQVAEASLAVRDDMQNQGIGTELLIFLVERAREAGIRRLVASAQRGNRALWRLLEKAPVRMEYESDGGYTTMTAHLVDPETA